MCRESIDGERDIVSEIYTLCAMYAVVVEFSRHSLC